MWGNGNVDEQDNDDTVGTRFIASTAQFIARDVTSISRNELRRGRDKSGPYYMPGSLSISGSRSSSASRGTISSSTIATIEGTVRLCTIMP